MVSDVLALEWHSPWAFALLFPLVLAAFRAWTHRAPGILVGTIRPAKSSSSPGRMLRIPLVLELLGAACLVLALARPQHVRSVSTRQVEGIDIMVALDVSGSMRAIDVPGGAGMGEDDLLQQLNSGELLPRIEVAKHEIERFVLQRPNDRIGLLAFSGLTVTLCPPTLDHDFLIQRLKLLDIGILDNVSTSIAPPIAAATTRLRKSKARRRVIILLTDGEDSGSAPATPTEVADIAAQFDITVHTIAIGSPAAFIREESFFGAKWQAVEHFNPMLIRTIAEKTKGLCLAAEDASRMGEVMKQINQLETTSVTKREFKDYEDRFTPLLLAGFIFLVIGFFLQSTVFLQVP